MKKANPPKLYDYVYTEFLKWQKYRSREQIRRWWEKTEINIAIKEHHDKNKWGKKRASWGILDVWYLECINVTFWLWYDMIWYDMVLQDVTTGEIG